MEKYCQVGKHPMGREEWVCSCIVCQVMFCVEHQGNDPLPGDFLSCPEHVQQVDAQNEARWQTLRRKFHHGE